MLFLALLVSIALSGSYVGVDESFADVDDARQACVSQGLDLCSTNQLHQVVFGTDQSYATPQMCLSAFMTDGSVGWWNSDADFCSGYGYKTYARAGPGAHCCSSDIPAPEPITCQLASSPCTGTRILQESTLSLYCPDGLCSDDYCCEDFTPAAVYKHVGTQYDYTDETEALDACQTVHPDYQLCTKTQILSLYDNGYGEPVCTSGWHWDDENSVFGRGFYNNEETAANGFCGGKTGWRGWAPASGEGSAHCCVPSYVKSGYHALGDLTGQSAEEQTNVAREYCNGRNGYPYQLCTQRQMFMAAYTGEADNICMSGRLETPAAGDESDSMCGWEQVSEDCGNGSTGWKGWCPANQVGAHCCLDYVQSWYPEYTKSSNGYDIYPEFYWDSSFTNGPAANTWCQEQGYNGVCTVEQVKYTAENQGSYGSLGCKVGHATETDGSYVSGYWGTACGKEDRFYESWQPPAGQNPTAHCCDEDVPSSSRAPAVQDPLVKVGGYDYASFEAASGQCDSDNGYSVCTRDQVELVATVGTARSDETVQVESQLCYQGFMADGSKGWYQGVEGPCGGSTGWREFNGNAGLFCCLGFEAQIGTKAPTKAPAVPVYEFLGAWLYPYGSAQEALSACEELSPAYSLCSDDEVVTMSTVGQESSSEAFESVATLTVLLSGWTDPDRSEPEYQVGRYTSNGWNDWAMADESTETGKRAGAHCCVASMVDSAEHPEIVETTTTTTTEEPTMMPTTTTVVETTTTTTTEEPTMMPTTTTEAATTQWVSYSDLPSTAQSPEGCVARPDLVPAGFEGVIQYCATGDLVYVNGRTTCVDPSDIDADSLVRNAFENDWYFAVGQCDGVKDYEMATDDQLFVTNHMLNELEADIDQLETDMAAGSSDLDEYLSDWKAQVAALINDNMSNFDETTQAALQNYVANNLNN